MVKILVVALAALLAIPAAAQTAVAVPTPLLAGLPPVAAGVKVDDYLWKAWGTGDIPAKDVGEGAFRFLCAPSHNAYDDPIVYPDQPGKSHLHTFFGNTKADANSTYASLRTTGDGTCNNLLNRSAYWIAAMMNGRGQVVMPDYVSIYYKGHASTSPDCREPVAKACLALPRGLRYIFGYDMLKHSVGDPVALRYWNCDGPGAIAGFFPTIAAAAKGCPVGARLGAVITGPACWNGRDLDSADHRGHMAYRRQDGAGRNVCPKTHPYLLPQFTLGAWYAVDATLADWFLSSDRMAGLADQPPGTTLHTDWWGAWDDSVLARWQANCIEKLLSCSGGDLGDGWQMATTAGYELPQGRPLAEPPGVAMGH